METNCTNNKKSFWYYVNWLALTALLLVGVNTSYGQTANTYTYSSSTAGALITQTSPTTIVNPNIDDTPSSLQSIGFNFTFEGVTYTQFSASPDGFIRLGSTAASSQYSNSVTSTTNVPKLYPFWDDLATGSSTGGGYVRFSVEGSAPNRILVVEWNVTIPRSTSGTPNSIMQAQLYETTNVIQFVYGAVGGTTGSASIGITGATATNYISITSPALTASTTTANNSNTTWPGTGTVLTFSPPVGCTGTPNAGTTVSSSGATACPGNAFTLSLNGADVGAGFHYQWQLSTDSISWFNIAGATSSSYSTNISSTTYYRCLDTCTNSGSSAISVPLRLDISPFLGCYCTSGLHNFASNCITNVNVNTLNNTSASTCSLPSYVAYGDTGVATTTLGRGNTYTCNIATNATFTAVQVWIDFNHSGTFDPSEYFVIADANNGASAYSAPITIAPTAMLGLTKMRVRTRSFLTTGSDACTQYGSGETEDYFVTIDTCPYSPSVTLSPSGTVNACRGLVPTITATPSGNIATPQYQWLFNGNPVVGAVSDTFTPTQSGLYSVQVNDGSNVVCGVTSVADTLNINAAPVDASNVTNYTLCQNTAIPSGLGLTATAGVDSANVNTATATVTFTNGSVDEGTTSPGIAIGSFTLPVLPAGAVVTNASIAINGIVPYPGTFESEVNLVLSGAITQAGTQISTTGSAPNPWNGVLQIAPYLIPDTGGLVNINYYESYNDNTSGQDDQFPATATLTITYIMPGTVTWYDAPTGGNVIGTGSPFDPLSGGLATTTTVYYAQTVGAICNSQNRVADTLFVLPAPTVTINPAGPLGKCIGDVVTLNANGGLGHYAWSTGDTTTSIVISATGTYKVTVTNAAGCSTVDSVVATFSPQPTVSLGTDITQCGGSVVMDAGNPGLSYTWSNGATTQLDTVTTTGIYTVSVSNNGCVGTGSKNVTINPAPAIDSVTASPNQLCLGGSTNLTAYSAAADTTLNFSNNTPSGTIPDNNTNGLLIPITVSGLNGPLTANSIVSVCLNAVHTWDGDLQFDLVSPAGTHISLSNQHGGSGDNYTGTCFSTTAGTAISSGSAPFTGTFRPDGNFATLAGENGNGTWYLYAQDHANGDTGHVINWSMSIKTINAAYVYNWSPAGTLSASNIANPVATPSSNTTYTVTLYNTHTGCSSTATKTINVSNYPVVNLGPDTTQCGGPYILDAGNAGSTYAWSNARTTQLDSIMSTGTYSVTVTNAGGCSASDTVAVTINAVPLSPTGATGYSVCQGSTVAGGQGLTATTLSGPSTATATVTFTNSASDEGTSSPGKFIGSFTLPVLPPGAVITGASIPINGIVPYSGTYQREVRLVLSGAITQAGTAISTLTTAPNPWNGTLVINPALIPTTGGLVNINYYETYNDNSSGQDDQFPATATLTINYTLPSVTVNWYDAPTGGNLVGTGSPFDPLNGGVATTPGTTTYYAGTSTATCSSSTRVAADFTVNPLPTAPLNDTTSSCTSSVTLDAGNVGSTYLWSDASTNQTLAVTADGSYAVTVTTANGCSLTDQTQVVLNTNPVIPFASTITQCGGTVTLDAGNTGATYLWSDASTNQTLSVTTSGTYSVTVTGGVGCTSTKSTTVTINPVPTQNLGADVTQCGGTVTLDAGNAGDTYLWSDASTNQTLTVSTSGTYMVTVTNGSSCSQADTIHVTINPIPTVFPGTITNCGPAIVDAGSGGTSYAWSDGVTTRFDTISASNTYTVTVTNSFGCTASAANVVTINPVPTQNLGPDVSQCGGTVTLDAGNAGSTYLWSDASTNQTLVATTSGTYSVTVTNGSGCSQADTIVVSINQVPTVNLGNDISQCGGTALLDAGTSGFLYHWSTGAATQTINVGVTADYSVTVTNAAGCAASDTIHVAINANPVVNLGAPVQHCGGTVVLNAANPGATYAWSTGATTQTITVGADGNYCVTVTNAAGCTATSCDSVTILPLPVVNLGAPVHQCNLNPVTLDAGNPGATSYAWSNGATTQLDTVTSSGTYMVTVTGTNGCSATNSIAVSMNNPPTIASVTASVNPTCAGGNTQLSANTLNQTVSFSNNTPIGIPDNNSTGITSNIIVTGINPATLGANSIVSVCMNVTHTFDGDLSFQLISPSGTTIYLSNRNGSFGDNFTGTCFSANASTAISAGSAPFSGSYRPDDAFTGLTGNVNGLWQMHVVDHAGGDVGTLQNWTISFNNTNPNYVFHWSPATALSDTVSQNPIANPMDTTMYYVTLTDTVTGCSSTDSVRVDVNQYPVVNLGNDTTFCGTSVTFDAGNPGATYTWSDTHTSQIDTITASGTYRVTVTSNGCTKYDTVQVQINQIPVVPTNVNGYTVCQGHSIPTGQGLTATAAVDTSVYYTQVDTIYFTNLTGNEGNSDATAVQVATLNLPGLPAGAVPRGATVNINGINLQTGSYGSEIHLVLSGAITQAGTQVASTFTTPNPVNGVFIIPAASIPTSSGTVNFGYWESYNDVTNGPDALFPPTGTITIRYNAPATINWYDSLSGGSLVGSGTPFDPLNGAPYTTVGTTTYYAEAATTTCNSPTRVPATLTVNPSPVQNLGPDVTQCGGSVTLDAGNPGDTYQWETGETTQTLTVSTTGTYMVTVSAPNGCSTADTINVTINALPVVNLGNDTLVCGNTVYTLHAGNLGSTYEWSDGSYDEFLDVTTSGDYSVTVTSPYGCATADTVHVDFTTPPSQNLGPDVTQCGGTVTLDAGNPGATYVWDDATTNQTRTVDSTADYSVTVTDASGCITSDTINVTINPPTVVDLGPDTLVCGGSTYVLDAGNPGSFYIWDDFSINETYDVTSNGTHYVTVINQYGCIGSDTVTVTFAPAPVVSLGADITQCGGNVTLDAGNPGDTYLWSTGDTTQTITQDSSAAYSVTVTNASGCSTADTINVTINPLPTQNLGPDVTQCAGTVTLDAGNAGDTYLWSTSDTTQTIVVSTSGDYSVDVTNVFGCATSDTITVTINPLPVVALGPDTTQCGGSITFDAGNAGSTYAWSTGDSLQTATVSASGDVAVTVTNGFGCVASDTVNVTINPTPTQNLGADITQCGGSVNLDAGNVGDTYAWSDSSTNQTLLVTATGTYSVTVSNSFGCSTADTIDITINPSVAVNLGPDTTQCGGTVTLDAGNAGLTYAWSTGDTTQTSTIGAIGTNTVVVTVTNSFGCFAIDTALVTINQQPVNPLDTVTRVCVSTAILDAGNPGATYVWSDGSTGRIITVTNDTTVSVTITYPGGCSVTGTAQVVVNATVSAGLTLNVDTLCANASVVTLSGGAPAGGTYLGAGVFQGTFDPAIVGVGDYAISYLVQDSTGCYGNASDTIHVEACTGIDEPFSVATIDLYPNPNEGNFNLVITNGHMDDLNIEVTTVEGRKVFSLEHQSVQGSYSKQFNLSYLAKGVYFMRLVSGTTATVKRVVIQ